MEASVKRFIALLSAMLLCGVLGLAGCAEQETYTPAPKAAAVADEALAAPGTITVGVDTSQGKAPLAGVSTAGKVVGMDVDLAVWLADELGLKVKVVDVSADPVGSLEAGDVDILLGVSAEETGSNLWLSSVYVPTAVVLFSLDPNAGVPADDSNPQISAEAAKVSAWAVANEFGADSLVSGNDMGEVFEMLRDGSVQYAAADALIGLYAANTVHCDANIVALMQKPTGYCVGVRADNAELQQAITSAMLKLSANGILDKMVETKWLNKPISLDSVPYTELAGQIAGADAEPEAEAEGGEGEGGEA